MFVMSFRHFAAAAVLYSSVALAQDGTEAGWPAYGGDPGGMRYSPATQIKAGNLDSLHPVWTFHTHALDRLRTGFDDASFEATPVLSRGTLYFASPFDVVFALDARTGRQLWAFDPRLSPLLPGDIVTSRGVSVWPSSSAQHDRIFLGTLDGRLIALDAVTGLPCPGFGISGQIDLTAGIAVKATYRVTSPPAIVGNVVIVGSMIGDNQFVDSGSGVVRAYDAITGRLLWTWDPIPWSHRQKVQTGGANTWSVISVDAALGLVYLPTSSAAPDFYGGMRPGDNADADSIVALNAQTGARVWAFQTVHHDLWDYDIPAQPLLFSFRNTIPAVAVSTKMGLLFVLDRRNGHPLFPVHERPVPQTGVAGEQTSPTQPFQDIAPLSPLGVAAQQADLTWQRSSGNQQICAAQLHGLRDEGIYTPPSIGGTLLYPGSLGGVNWGSAAFDPRTGVLYANTNRAAFSIRLIPRTSWEARKRDLSDRFFDWANWGIAAGLAMCGGMVLAFRRSRSLLPGPFTFAITAALMLACIPIAAHKDPPNLVHFGHDLGAQRLAPYLVQRDVLVDHDGNPCVSPPWGSLAAVNLNTGAAVFHVPLGSRVAGQRTGILNFGGPIVTASGLVFTAAAEDNYLRAFDAASGKELWRTLLPASAQATPMTYMLEGRQYLVIAAGGHGDHATVRGDSLIAFALDRQSVSAP